MSAQRSSSHLERRTDRQLGEVASKVFGMALIVGLIGVVLSLVIAMLGGEWGGWDRFLKSYLMAFMFVLSLCLGALFFVMLQHAVKAGWSVVIRRLAESVASNLTWIWILFIPILIGLYQGHLYHWNEPGLTDLASSNFDAVIAQKAPYLNATFWTIRAVAFFVIWALLARFFVGTSIAQDSNGDISLTRRMEKFAPLGLLLFAVTQSFAAIDWIMSLEPHWFSTMFPVYFFAASCCGYFALQILMMFFVQRNNKVRSDITPEHYQDAGKLLFAFGVVFWAYIGFSQYMLIWYANLPEETTWYMTRQMGGWGVVILLLLFGHFIGPFLALISRHPKRMKAMLAGAAMWMLFIHIVDIYWLVMPKVPEAVHYATSYQQLSNAVSDPQSQSAQQLANLSGGTFNASHLDIGFNLHLLDLTCLIGLAALLIAGTAKRLSGCSLIPERDPRLHESLAFENM